MNANIELLQLELETLWVTAPGNRLVRGRDSIGLMPPYLAHFAAQDGCVRGFAAYLPDVLVSKIEAEMDVSAPAAAPDEEPHWLRRCADLLAERLGPVQVTCGPTYLVGPGVTYDACASVAIVRSVDERAHDLPEPRAAMWEPGEWDSLTAGELGPWAAVLVDGRVASLCHSARLTDRAAEAGTWTAPEHRSRGYAAAATAAWAALLAPTGRTLFYSTSAENQSSRRVAARLGLPEIGWQWRVERPT
jgi:hypothetical protein